MQPPPKPITPADIAASLTKGDELRAREIQLSTIALETESEVEDVKKESGKADAQIETLLGRLRDDEVLVCPEIGRAYYLDSSGELSPCDVVTVEMLAGRLNEGNKVESAAIWLRNLLKSAEPASLGVITIERDGCQKGPYTEDEILDAAFILDVIETDHKDFGPFWQLPKEAASATHTPRGWLAAYLARYAPVSACDVLNDAVCEGQDTAAICEAYGEIWGRADAGMTALWSLPPSPILAAQPPPVAKASAAEWLKEHIGDSWGVNCNNAIELGIAAKKNEAPKRRIKAVKLCAVS